MLSNHRLVYSEGRQTRVVSDGDLNTSGSSTESGPRQRSAEQVRRPPRDSKTNKTYRKGNTEIVLKKSDFFYQ